MKMVVNAHDVEKWFPTPFHSTEAKETQLALAAQLNLTRKLGSYRTIAAVDVSCKKGNNLIHAAVVLWDSKTKDVIAKTSASIEASIPYIPGYLSFRELPAVLQALEKLTYDPDVFLVDGHGIAHPRMIGIAAHLGALLEMPTIGCGKSVLCGTYEEPGPKKGDCSPLMYKQKQIATALRTRNRVKPVFVSPGNLCTMSDAVRVVLENTSRYRLPDPIRAAHNFASEVRLKSS